MKRERLSKSDLKEMEEDIEDAFISAKLDIYEDQIISRGKKLGSLQLEVKANLEAREMVKFEANIREFCQLKSEMVELSKKIKEFITNFTDRNSTVLEFMSKSLNNLSREEKLKVKIKMTYLEMMMILIEKSDQIVTKVDLIIETTKQSAFVKKGPTTCQKISTKYFAKKKVLMRKNSSVGITWSGARTQTKRRIPHLGWISESQIKF